MKLSLVAHNINKIMLNQWKTFQLLSTLVFYSGSLRI